MNALSHVAAFNLAIVTCTCACVATAATQLERACAPSGSDSALKAAEWAQRSCGHADDPTAETHFAIQPGPPQVAVVRATRVADVDAVVVVADPYEPVALPEPASTIQQQWSLLQPCLEFGELSS